MRKLLTLTGFIIFMFGIWGLSMAIIGGLFSMYPFIPYFSSIAGIIVMIAGILTHPKELKEPFRSIAEKFERMNKPILVAAILIFFSSLWLLFYGFFGIAYYHAAEIIFNMPIGNNTASQENATEILLKTITHKVNTTILTLAYLEVFAGIICIAATIETLRKRHLSFIISSLVFAIFISVTIRYYYEWIAKTHLDGTVYFIGGMPLTKVVYLCFILPAIASMVAILLILWQYKEYIG